jgi:hypothetical protein
MIEATYNVMGIGRTKPEAMEDYLMRLGWTRSKGWSIEVPVMHPAAWFHMPTGVWVVDADLIFRR